jgi:hypothetical protein
MRMMRKPDDEPCPREGEVVILIITTTLEKK